MVEEKKKIFVFSGLAESFIYSIAFPVRRLSERESEKQERELILCIFLFFFITFAF